VRFYILKGDPTSCGGEVLTGSPNHLWNGKMLARIGDQVTCGKHAGVYVIGEGYSGRLINNRQAVLNGMRTTCPCGAVVIETQHHYGAGVAAPVHAAAKPKKKSKHAKVAATQDPVAKLEATEWGRKALAYAEQMGVNKKALAATCEIESGCRNLTKVHSKTITGPFQMTKRTYKASIQKAVRDNPSLNLTKDQIEKGNSIPEVQSIAAAQYLKDAGNSVQGVNINDPTALDTRGYYQFGQKYGNKIANAGENETMGSILTGTANKTFIKNGITKQTTVGEWRNMVRDRMGGFADESISSN